MREQNTQEENQPIRVKLPRGKEVIGIIEQRLGGNRMAVSCTDKITRNCRVPGRLQRKLWLRPNDIVIVEPWEFDNGKADVIFKYTPTQIQWLKTKGYLKSEESEF
jgi:translation initiation factor 1A